MKYRKNLLTGEIDSAMKTILEDIATISDFSIEIMESDQNHIHLLINAVPKLSPLQIVRHLKSISTYGIWKLYPLLLRQHFWKDKTFWSDGYFVCTTGQVSTQLIIEYIQKQG